MSQKYKEGKYILERSVFISDFRKSLLKFILHSHAFVLVEPMSTSYEIWKHVIGDLAIRTYEACIFISQPPTKKLHDIQKENILQ